MNTQMIPSAQPTSPHRRLSTFPLFGIGVLAVALGPGCGAAGPVEPCDPSLARTLVVEHGDEVATVLLGDLPGEPDGERCLVSLEDVVLGANLGLDLADTFMDLRSDDGFRPRFGPSQPRYPARFSRSAEGCGAG